MPKKISFCSICSTNFGPMPQGNNGCSEKTEYTLPPHVFKNSIQFEIWYKVFYVKEILFYLVLWNFNQAKIYQTTKKKYYDFVFDIFVHISIQLLICSILGCLYSSANNHIYNKLILEPTCVIVT